MGATDANGANIPLSIANSTACAINPWNIFRSAPSLRMRFATLGYTIPVPARERAGATQLSSGFYNLFALLLLSVIEERIHAEHRGNFPFAI
jgi:hypothetical protein